MSQTASDNARRAIDDASDRLEGEADAYRHGEDRPLGPYAALMGIYAAGVVVGGIAARRKGLPERVGIGDLALISVATHKLSRLVTKDPVTSPLRAPFTSFSGTSGPAELSEDVRGTGARKAVGELVTCPFCVAQWSASAFAFGLVLAPRATRLAASILTAVTAADFLHLAYAGAEKRVS